MLDEQEPKGNASLGLGKTLMLEINVWVGMEDEASCSYIHLVPGAGNKLPG